MDAGGTRVVEDGGGQMAAERSDGGSPGCGLRWSSEALSVSLSRHRERSPSLEVRLARLSAMAARANAGSSSCSSKSPRLGQQWCAGSSTPSPRSSQDGQRSRKRKSPHVCTPLFRFPLSRMLLSPRMQLPRAHIRSPLVSRRATLLDIDLNMEPEDSQENPEGDPLGQQNEENGSNLQGDPLGQQNEENGSNLQGDLLGHQNEENGSNLGGDSHSQQNAPGEVEPTRTIRNKNYIPKIQILTAVGRPRFDSEGRCIFYGKIGCWAFVTYEPAKRSKCEPARRDHRDETNRIYRDETNRIDHKGCYEIFYDRKRSCLQFVPSGHTKMLASRYTSSRTTPNHMLLQRTLFCEAAKEDGFDIRIICQPANSPDLNVLDLGFFSALQSVQHKKTAKTTEELVAAVSKAFEEYSVDQLNRIFLTLHGCMKEVMKISGVNGYDVPHIRKGVLERQGQLPLKLKCDALLVQEVMGLINE